MVVGGDRVAEFEKRMRPYVNHKDPKKSYNFDNFEVVNSGARVEGVSGTDMRNHVKNDDYDSFKAGLPKGLSDKQCEQFWNDIKKGMKL
jgi:hypothetical protein